MSSTASDMASATTIPQLPLDVWKVIADRLEGLDLKKLRRVNKSLAEVCANYLFQEISLVPWTSCLQGFNGLLKTTTLGTHVRKITYDDRWHLHFWDFCRAMKPVDEGAVQNIVDEYHDLESVSATPDAEVALLTDIFSLLPQLTEIEIIENTQSSKDDDPPHWFVCFVRKICQGQDDDDSVEINGENCDSCHFDRSTALTVIAALPQQLPSLRTLNIRGMDCMGASSFKITPTASLSSLQTLDLIFTMREPTQFTEQYRESSSLSLSQNLASFLTSASNLQQLSIRGESRYGNPGTLCDGRELLIKCLVQSNTLFPNLHTFSVQETPIHGSSLVTFLSRHNGILETLTLKNLILTSDRHPDSPAQPPLCLTVLLHTLKFLSLHSFSFGGLLASTSSSQKWHFPSPIDTKTYDFHLQSEIASFLKSRNTEYCRSMNVWGCGNPGYGCQVEGGRYPCLGRGRWFDGRVVHAIENWVLARGEEGVGGEECPMQKFGVGGEEVLKKEEGMRLGWRVWVWWGGGHEEEEAAAVGQVARRGWEYKGAEIDHETR